MLIKVLIALLTACSGYAQNSPTRLPAQSNKSVEELKRDYEAERIPTNLFLIRSNMVVEYSWRPLADSDSRKEASKLAHALLLDAESFRKNWNYGNAIHYSHIVLGRVKLLSGDITGAAESLKAAGNSPSSPQLNSFGPNMTLARELLEKGQKQPVLKYFSQVSTFWTTKFSAPYIARWKKEVNEGKIPEFGYSAKR